MTFPTTSTNETPEGTAPAPAPEQTPAANQPSYITAEQLSQTIGQLKAEYQQKLDQVYRGTKYRQDQFTTKVNKKREVIESAAKASGIPFTDAQRSTMKAMADFQVLSEETPTAQSGGFVPGQAQPQGEAESELEARVNQAAITMQQVWGVEILSTDPEDAIMKAVEDGNIHTPKEYLDAVQQAIQSKLARTKGASPTAEPPAAPGSPHSPG